MREKTGPSSCSRRREESSPTHAFEHPHSPKASSRRPLHPNGSKPCSRRRQESFPGITEVKLRSDPELTMRPGHCIGQAAPYVTARSNRTPFDVQRGFAS